MKEILKNIICAALCILVVMSFAGCGAGKPGTETEPAETVSQPAEEAKTGGINLFEKLSALATSDVDLGIDGKYNVFEDITDGKIDPALTGKWISADGKTVYTYGEDGICNAEFEGSENSGLRYTCISAGGKNIIVDEAEMMGDVEEGTLVLSYYAYSVENGVLFMVPVEEYNPDYSSSQNALLIMFRADENGGIEAAVSENPIDLNAFSGTWSSDTGSISIENGTLKADDDIYNISFDDQNRLVAEKDGQSTAYGFSITAMKDYDIEDRSQFTEKTCFNIYYEGADENDKPNLLSVMTDWKAEYEYDRNYFSANFEKE